MSFATSSLAWKMFTLTWKIMTFSERWSVGCRDGEIHSESGEGGSHCCWSVLVPLLRVFPTWRSKSHHLSSQPDIHWTH